MGNATIFAPDNCPKCKSDNITSDNLWGNGDFDPYGNINPFAPGKTKGSKKNKPAYKLKSSGILKKGHKRGAGY